MPGGSDGHQDADEKFDPAAAIWEQQIKKKKQAEAKRHEEKHSQLDQVRKHVKLEETKDAVDIWKEAEAGLNQVLKGKRHEAAKAAAVPDRDNGLRKHGESVKHRHNRAFAGKAEGSQASPPLQRSALPDSLRTLPASDSSEGEEMEAGTGSWSESPRLSPSSLRSTARLGCFEKRSEQRRQKARGPTEALAAHARQRLRAKIATVLIEVRKRQDLHQAQEKAKKFREYRFAAGKGPTASLGDTTEVALGLTCLSQSGSEQAMTSPRRTALLDSMTLEELALARDRPAFFFTGNAIAGACSPGQLAGGDKNRSMAATTGSFSTTSSPAPKGLWPGLVDADAFEDIIEFFSVSSADKDLEVSIYARNLRTQLSICAGRHNGPNGRRTSTDIDWRKRLCRSEPEDDAQEEQQTVAENLPKAPLEMMPSLGRHPPIRCDQESPTLSKVREVYQRRHEQDAQYVDERKEGITRRAALNAFKAREQQRELLLQDFKQKELHKVRMLQAEEKKAMLDAEALDRTEVMGMQKIHRLMVANMKSETVKEEKRDNAQLSLEAWQAGVVRARECSRKTEHERLKEGERNHLKYMQRLTAMGESRMNNSSNRSQGQLNDELKIRIQDSLASQIKEQDVEAGAARVQAIREKQEQAAIRRHTHQSGNRYCFVEKAFGANAAGFDAKHHAIATDRRSKSWQKSAEAWAKMKGSFSAPVLPPASPLSPGGSLNEASFKTLRDCGLKTSSSAVALA